MKGWGLVNCFAQRHFLNRRNTEVKHTCHHQACFLKLFTGHIEEKGRHSESSIKLAVLQYTSEKKFIP